MLHRREKRGDGAMPPALRQQMNDPLYAPGATPAPAEPEEDDDETAPAVAGKLGKAHRGIARRGVIVRPY